MLTKRWRRRGASTEKGQTLILVAVVFVVLLGMGAMSVDVGQILWSRGAEQNIADAAALAGVRDLPGNPTDAVTLATNYARSNYPSSEPITVNAYVKSERYSNDAIVVDVHRTLQPGLRAAVGGGAIDVPAEAEAIVTAVDNGCGVWPWGITTSTYDTIQFGVPVTLKVGAGNQYSPGNFGALALTGPGAANYKDAITNKACVDNPSSIPVETGNIGVTVKTVNDLIDAVDPGAPSAWNSFCSNPANAGLCTWVSGYKNNGMNGATIPDNVYYSPPSPPSPYGLGCPMDNQCYCSGNPTTDPPYVTVEVGTGCGRVGIVPVVQEPWPNGGSGNVTVANPPGWLGFYLVGAKDNGGNGHDTITGVFLKVVAAPGKANGGDPNSATQVYYYLYK